MNIWGSSRMRKRHKADMPAVDKGRFLTTDPEVRAGLASHGFTGFHRTDRDNRVGVPVTARLMGDPLPGRSAADMKRAAEAMGLTDKPRISLGRVV